MNLYASIKSLETPKLLALYNELTGKSTSKFASREKGESQVIGVAKVAGEKSVLEAAAKIGIALNGAAGPAKVAAPKSVADLPTPTPIAPKAVSPAATAAKKSAQSPARVLQAKEAKPANGVFTPKPYGDKCPLCGADESSVTAAGKEGTIAGDERGFCHSCNKEFWLSSGKEYARAKPGKDVGASISRSWLNAEVRAARSTRHAVMACLQGEQASEFKSTAEAFRMLRLPMSKHIKFRGALKAKGKLNFEFGNKTYVFKLAK